MGVGCQALKLMETTAQRRVLRLLVFMIWLSHYPIVEVIVRKLKKDARIVVLRWVRCARIRRRGEGERYALLVNAKTRTSPFLCVLRHAVIRTFE